MKLKSTDFKKTYFILFCAVFCFFTGCSSLSSLKNEAFSELDESSYIPEKIEWKKINSLSEYFLFENKNVPLRYHLVKIDLSSQSLKISAYPLKKNELGKGASATSFAKKSGSFVSINTSPFKGRFFSKRKIVGIHKIREQILSEENGRYSALGFKTEKDGSLKAFVANQNELNSIEDFNYVFGGFFEILKDDEEIEFSYSSRNSRTAAGISSDGKTLFLLVVEGERKNLSRGLSYGECAKILKSAGSADALEFDGGSSSSLFIDGKNVLLNRNFRKCAAFFGFCTSGK